MEEPNRVAPPNEYMAWPDLIGSVLICCGIFEALFSDGPYLDWFMLAVMCFILGRLYKANEWNRYLAFVSNYQATRDQEGPAAEAKDLRPLGEEAGPRVPPVIRRG